jgi:hypothetical protein
MQLVDNQEVVLTVAAEDSKGEPVADTITFTVDNADVIALTDNGDGTALCVAGIPGSATVTATDSSTPPITATEAFTVVSGTVSSLVISAGTPTTQPGATTPAS